MTSARVAVLLPVHDQAAWLPRALDGLLAQQLTDWEAVVLDDGSRDPAAVDTVLAALADPRVRLLRWPVNRGLGATLNAGLDATTAPLVAHLPADDVWAVDHLSALVASLADPAVVLARSGLTEPSGTAYAQLVQVAHRRTPDRWTERSELESDDLDRLCWQRVAARGRTADTGRVTCTWTRHPGQRSRAIRESFDGGLNVFRSRYRVPEPLRFASSDSGEVDEVARYARFRERCYPAPDGLSCSWSGSWPSTPNGCSPCGSGDTGSPGCGPPTGWATPPSGRCRSGTCPTSTGTTGATPSGTCAPTWSGPS